jgi:hypothetical protein
VSQSPDSDDTDVGYVQYVSTAGMPPSLYVKKENAAGAAANMYTFTPRLHNDSTGPDELPVPIRRDRDTMLANASSVVIDSKGGAYSHFPDKRAHVRVQFSEE